jgi:hypothetical protein
MVEYPPVSLSLGPHDVHFIGSRVDHARALWERLVTRDEPGASRHRAALNVVRSLIDDPGAETIGGEVQIGHMVGWAFRRVASVVPVPGQAPRARMLLNSIDLEDLQPVGPCAIGLQGMISP